MSATATASVAPTHSEEGHDEAASNESPKKSPEVEQTQAKTANQALKAAAANDDVEHKEVEAKPKSKDRKKDHKKDEKKEAPKHHVADDKKHDDGDDHHKEKKEEHGGGGHAHGHAHSSGHGYNKLQPIKSAVLLEALKKVGSPVWSGIKGVGKTLLLPLAPVRYVNSFMPWTEMKDATVSGVKSVAHFTKKAIKTLFLAPWYLGAAGFEKAMGGGKKAYNWFKNRKSNDEGEIKLAPKVDAPSTVASNNQSAAGASH